MNQSNSNKQYTRVPFDIELAKKIQSGEVEGKIVTAEGDCVRIVCFDRKGFKDSILALITINDSYEIDMFYTSDGEASKQSRFDIHIELPEETPKYEFKVGDKIKIIKVKSSKDSSFVQAMYLGNCYIIHEVLDNAEKVCVIDPIFGKVHFQFEEIEPYEEKHEFKPFDKVLVRGGTSTAIQERNIWVPAYYQHHDYSRYVGDDEIYFASGLYWKECLPYEGNEHLVGTTNNPKEE